jgi:hypothetical protein
MDEGEPRMTTYADVASLEQQIAQWRDYLRRRRAIHSADLRELEDHLRDQMAALADSGLQADEAFLVAVKRMGNLDVLSREFAREHAERLWKQLVIAPRSDDQSDVISFADVWMVLGFALAAAVAIKVPAFFGLHMTGDGEPFYLRDASLLVLPFLTAYFALRRGTQLLTGLGLSLAFGVAAVFANLYPFVAGSHAQVLTALHLPIALWLIVGIAYAGGRWFANGRRMDFVRFSGELFIYYALIAFGGGVLTALTLMMFSAIGVNAQGLAREWLLPCGAVGAVIIGSWLVEAKQSVIENMAPVLTKLFTPLFAVVLLAFLATLVWTGNPIDVKREVLIVFDLLLALVLGLVLYAISARDPQSPAGLFDGLQLVLIAIALLVDTVALAAIARRISEFGFTPNRIAALGENLILFVNLAGSAWLNARFLRGSGPFAALERWQITYLPVYSIWAAFVVVFFPPAFGYR